MDASYFFTQFAAYNTDWLHVNVILWLLLVIATALVFVRPADVRSQALIKGALALAFLWNGIVFFFFYMTLSAVPGGIPMVVIGVLFAVDIFRRKITISLPASGWVRHATLAWAAWALGLYTIAGWITGHPYPGGPLPAAPCPTTILAIALLSTSMATLKTARLPFALLFALLLWWAFFAGIFAPVLYGFLLDLTLLAAGVYGLGMNAANWSRADMVN
ncbi:MAG: hypothetical protein A4E40_01481 [Methanoregulaceae archaeon PtaU1.Bin059]|nr:MAG: hypothetical protein A4E39_01009 [Methanoregulaceae archaeon PtaB.Bin152]OPY36665.1 MAG: hypothetical protein A4E40_01481 [Methanoregulaceae archaeon PtaU1.Bin059]